MASYAIYTCISIPWIFHYNRAHGKSREIQNYTWWMMNVYGIDSKGKIYSQMISSCFGEVPSECWCVVMPLQEWEQSCLCWTLEVQWLISSRSVIRKRLGQEQRSINVSGTQKEQEKDHLNSKNKEKLSFTHNGWFIWIYKYPAYTHCSYSMYFCIYTYSSISNVNHSLIWKFSSRS